MNLAEALAALDPADDTHWTTDGMPAVAAVQELAGDPSITRKVITDAAPALTRANAEVVKAEQQPPPDSDPESDHPDPDADEEPGELPGWTTYFENEPPRADEFVAFLNEVPADDLHEFADMLNEQLAGMREAREKLTELIARAQFNAGTAKARAKREVPDMTDAEARRAYIEQSGKTRAEQVARANELKAALGPMAADTRTPLTRAFAARKPTPGTQRPAWPFMRVR